MKHKIIYLDNAATTPVSDSVLTAMMPYYKELFYNPSSKYDSGYTVNNDINKAKQLIANTIGCTGDEIYITSGGTESDNWALRYVKPNEHLITSKIEHHAILNTCKYLESQGVQVTYLDVDKDGLVDPDSVLKALRPNTKLISIMIANNEIGTIQHINDIGKIAKEANVPFHTDAVQSYGHVLKIDYDLIDMMSVSAHKINGPKGIGFLYKRNGIKLEPILYGGNQQFGMRPGTDNVPSIIGMAKAVADIFDETRNGFDEKRIREMRDHLKDRIVEEIDGIKINGHLLLRLNNNLNVSFSGIRGEQLATLLSSYNICVSTGSACNSYSSEPSHVLMAIGLTEEEANSSIRFSLSAINTMEEIDYTVDILKQCVNDLRSIK